MAAAVRTSSMAGQFFASDDDEDDVGPRVRVNVYDIADVGMCLDLGDVLTTFNTNTLETWEMGVFHAGVEILGVEYSYGYCERGTGVYTCEPRRAFGARFRKSVEMGRARRDYDSIERRIGRLVKAWDGASYALLAKNCCHFVDVFCQDLGVGPIPKWVNGLAESLNGYTDWGYDPVGLNSLLSDYKQHPAIRAHHQPPTAPLAAEEDEDEDEDEDSPRTDDDGGGGCEEDDAAEEDYDAFEEVEEAGDETPTRRSRSRRGSPEGGGLLQNQTPKELLKSAVALSGIGSCFGADQGTVVGGGGGAPVWGDGDGASCFGDQTTRAESPPPPTGLPGHSKGEGAKALDWERLARSAGTLNLRKAPPARKVSSSSSSSSTAAEDRDDGYYDEDDSPTQRSRSMPPRKTPPRAAQQPPSSPSPSSPRVLTATDFL